MSSGLNKLNKMVSISYFSLNHKQSIFMLFWTHDKARKYRDRFKLSLDNVETIHIDAYNF